MDPPLVSSPDANDPSEGLNKFARRVDHKHGHLLQLLSNFPSSQSTVTTESQWRPLSEAERLSIGEADDLSQIRKRREEYAGFKERYNRLKRKDMEPAAIDDFSFRRRRDTRHRSQQDFDDTLSVHTYNSDTNFTEFSSYKAPPTSRFDRMRDTEFSPNIARFIESRFDRTRNTEYYIDARYESRLSATNSEVPLKRIAPSQSQFDQTRDEDHTGAPYKSHLSIGNSIEKPSSPLKQSARLLDDDVLSPLQDPLPPIMPSSAAPKQSAQEPLARPDIKGKGRMIRPPSPADKGQDRLTQTSPLHQQSPSQQIADGSIDDFEYDYGDDHLSTRSSRQQDTRQHDVIKKIEQDMNSRDNNLRDDPFEEDITGGVLENQNAGPSNIKRVERIRDQSDDDLMDLDDTRSDKVIRVLPGNSFAARSIEEMNGDGNTDILTAIKAKYGSPMLGKSNVFKLFKQISPLQPMHSTGKVLLEATELFLDQVVDDLVAYADHAGSQSITMQDVELLMARQGLLKETSIEALAHKYLSREHWDKICVHAMADNVLYPELPPH